MSSVDVIVFQNKLMEYRVELFKKLIHKGYNLKIVCSQNLSSQSTNVNIIRGLKIFGFNYFPLQIKTNNVILFECDLRNLNTYVFTFKNNSIAWGIWKTNNLFANLIRVLIVNLTKANVFYCNEHKEYFDFFTFNKSKNFVALNTTSVAPNGRKPKIGSYYLFVGSLNKRKGLKSLINCFEIVVQKYPKLKLILVGAGSYRNELEEFLQYKKSEVRNNVVFMGSITDLKKLGQLYENAICSVSYGQAGLSILQSLGNATPFITIKTAISGGEIYSIKEGVTGFRNINNENEFVEKMIFIHENKEQQLFMKKKSLSYYNKFATINKMSLSLIKAIEYER